MNFSEKPKTMIPKGVATLLPEETFRRRVIEKEILSSFSQWGYQEVISPIFEYLDVFSLGDSEQTQDSAYKFIDRATGRIMVLRPDVTPQIARMASTLLKDEMKPLRLCYSANVFRHQDEHAGRERELFQVGGELIGVSDAESDAEMISLTIDILKKLGLNDFRITLGQMAFTRGLLSPFKSSPVFFNQMLHCVAKKEAPQLEALLKQEGVSKQTRRDILTLLDLFGGETVLKRAHDLTDEAACREGIERLQAVYGILKSEGYDEYLLIDLGEVRGFDYYTGTIFEVFAEGVGSELGGGGRYDDLLGKFGASSPSTGFALNIERTQAALGKEAFPERSRTSVDFLALYSGDGRGKSTQMIRQLRAADFRVIQKRVSQLNDLTPFLKNAADQQIKKILVTYESAAGVDSQVIDVSSAEVLHQGFDDFSAWLKNCDHAS